MKDLQELKTWLEDQRLKAHKRRTISRKDNDAERLAYFAGKEAAFSLVLDEAELLFDMQPNSDIAQPLQQADVSGRSEQLATEIECSEYPHLKCNCIDGNCTNVD